MLLFFVASGLGNIRDDNDPWCTFEGDNNVLLQQGSNYEDFYKKRPINSPFHSIDFVEKINIILQNNRCSITPKCHLNGNE